MRFDLAFLTAGVCALIPACSCNGNECGPGTTRVGGSCVGSAPDGGLGCSAGTVPGPEGCVPASSPADRRPCQGRFGPVAEDAAEAVFVDASYDGGDSDGTASRPFTEISDAVEMAAGGELIGVAGGTYGGDFTIDTPLTIEGRCAQDVVVEGNVEVRDTGDVAIRGLTVTMGQPGVSVQNVQPIEAEAGLELRYVRITMNQGAGLVVEASDVQFLDSEVDRTAALSDDALETGAGIVILDGSNFVGRLGIVTMNGFIGVDGVDFTGDVVPAAATAPSEILLDQMEVLGNDGGGVRFGFDDGSCDAVPEEGTPGLSVMSSTISNNDGDGIQAACRPLSVLGSTLATNLEDAIDGRFAPATVAGNSLSGRAGDAEGRGVLLDGARAVVSGNRVEGFEGGGVQVSAAASAVVSGNILAMNGVRGIALLDVPDVTVQGNEVSGTLATRQGMDGHAVDVSLLAASTEPPFFASVRDNTLVDNGGAGILVSGYDTDRDIEEFLYTVDGNLLDGNGFYAINIQDSSGGQISNNVVRDAQGYGIRTIAVAPLLADARIWLLDNEMDGVASTGTKDGDCILVHSSHASIDGNTLAGCDRFGVYTLIDATGTVFTDSDRNAIPDPGVDDYVRSSDSAMTFTPDTSEVTSEPFDETRLTSP